MVVKSNPYRDLEKKIGYRFRQRELLVTALTHRSYTSEAAEKLPDNERLEFLGDAVLDFLVGAYLFEHFADSAEGVLTSYRSQMTNGKALARVGRDLGIGEYLRMGKGEDSSGGRGRPAALADAVEAVLGAVFVDRGLKGASKVFNCVFVPRMADLPGDVWAGNPKGRLQEICQKRWKSAPVYRVLEKEGPAHDVTFTVEVSAGSDVCCSGKGGNKQDAERKAAQKALARLDDMRG